jgi:hypothetical protein
MERHIISNKPTREGYLLHLSHELKSVDNLIAHARREALLRNFSVANNILEHMQFHTDKEAKLLDIVYGHSPNR